MVDTSNEQHKTLYSQVPSSPVAISQEPPDWARPDLLAQPWEAGADIWFVPERVLVETQTCESRRELLFPEYQALVVGWHVHLGERHWLQLTWSPGKSPVPPALPTYHPLQEQATGLAQVLQEGCVPQPPLRVPAVRRKEKVELWLGAVPQPTCPPSQAPHLSGSDLHLRVRSKSTLLCGVIFPLTA